MFTEERQPALPITYPDEYCGISNYFHSIWSRSSGGLKRAHDVTIKWRLAQGEKVKARTSELVISSSPTTN